MARFSRAACVCAALLLLSSMTSARAEDACGQPEPAACYAACQPCGKHCKRRCCASAPPQGIILQSVPVAFSSQILLGNTFALTQANAAALNVQAGTASRVDAASVAAVMQALQQRQTATASAAKTESTTAASADADCCAGLDARIRKLEQDLQDLDQKVESILGTHHRILQDVVNGNQDLKARYPGFLKSRE